MTLISRWMRLQRQTHVQQQHILTPHTERSAYLKELDHTLVREVQHDPDLALDALGLVCVCQLGLVDDFDGHPALAQVVDAQPNLRTRQTKLRHAHYLGHVH